MTWFKVDDGLHSHRKWLATSMAARGLWVTAGSWCADQLTDGHVPAHVLRQVGGTTRNAAELVANGLWDVVDDGWRFHQWDEFQPSREAVEAERAAARERQRRARDRAKSRRDSHANNGASHGPPDPTRPDLSTEGGVTTHDPRTTGPPPRRCQQHADDQHPPPCGACADARRHHDAWQASHSPPPPPAHVPPPVEAVLLKPGPIETSGAGLAAAKAALRPGARP